MQEKELMHWVLTVIFPIVISGATFYISAKNRTGDLEHRLTELEVSAKHQDKNLDSIAYRLDKYEEEQKIIRALVDRMDYMNEGLKSVKEDVDEIKLIVRSIK
nr:MAG TPA: cell division protein [Caudoviricetes sp.]